MTADLSALIARLEAAEAKDAWIHAPDVHLALFGSSLGNAAKCPPYTTALDAALALAERVLGNGPCVLHRNGPNEWGFTYVDDDTAYAATPALSVCVAILRAKQGEGE